MRTQMIQIVDGNLLDATEIFICHQVNCQGAMGSGVAKALYTKWPILRKEYMKYCSGKSPEELFGDIQFIKVDPTKVIVNLFTQLNYRRKNDIPGRVYTDYRAFDHCIKSLAERELHGCNLAMPYKIGCGLADGDWEIIHGILRKYYEFPCNPTLRLYRI